VLAAGLLVSAAPAWAQSPVRAAPTTRPDGGLWWSVSGGAGSAKLTCDLCDPTRDVGAALEAAVGTYASSQLRVGVEAGGWTYLAGDFRESVYSAGLAAELHPWRTRGLHLIGGLGWAGYRAGEVDVDEEGFRYDAVRIRLGAGWDLPLTGSWVVGNRLTLDASSLGTLRDRGNAVANRVGLSVVRLGIYVRSR